MSDAEKLVEAGLKYPDDPLILRPQVGGDLLRSRGVNRACWPRSVILRLVLICVLLATIAGCILIIFTLHHSGHWPWNYFHRRYSTTTGSCRVFTPLPGFGVEERYMYEPNAITIVHGAVAGFPEITTFHLLKEAMSVMRTHGICYVYPLDPEIAESAPIDDETNKELGDSAITQIKSPLGMRVFMVFPETNDRIKIEHPAAAANCSGIPIFRLIEMVLNRAGAQFDQYSGPIASLPAIPCPLGCSWGASRTNPTNQVCRCPPRDNPPDIALPQFPQQKEEDGEDEDEEDFGESLYNNNNSDSNDNEVAPTGVNGEVFKPEPPISAADDSDISDLNDDEDEIDKSKDDEISPNFEENFVDAQPWIQDQDGLTRRQRSVNILHEMEGDLKIPSGCVKIDEVLDGAVPTTRSHTLSKMSILKC